MKDGWEVKKLGELATVIAGQSPKSSSYNQTATGLPFYQGKKDYGERFLQPPTKWTTEVTKEAIAGDILMSVRAPVGPLNEATETICIGRGLAAIRATGLKKNYLWYALTWLKPKIAGSEGAVFASINKAQIADLPIPLPALDEQKRIVYILDEAFEGLDRARENAEANLKSARQLFEVNLSTAFELNGSSLPNNWEVKKLKELCNDFKKDIVDGPFGSNLKRKDYTSQGTPVLKIQNIKPFKIILKKMDFVSEQKAFELSRHTYRKDDIIITKLGQPLGVSAIVKDLDDGIIVADLVRVRACKIDTEFLCYQLNSHFVSAHLNSLQKGTTRPRVQISAVRELPIAVPPLDEQKRIVENLDQMSEQSRTLAAHYTSKLQDISDLRQSLLQKAFEGELK